MKPMIYDDTKDRKREILHTGIIDGIRFYIVSFCTHPCAYVKCDESVIDDVTAYDEIMCHGGITFIGSGFEGFEGGRYIGWDYAHYGDYMPFMYAFDGKKWTTEEIFEEVKEVIKQVKKHEN